LSDRGGKRGLERKGGKFSEEKEKRLMGSTKKGEIRHTPRKQP